MLVCNGPNRLIWWTRHISDAERDTGPQAGDHARGQSGQKDSEDNQEEREKEDLGGGLSEYLLGAALDRGGVGFCDALAGIVWGHDSSDSRAVLAKMIESIQAAE